MELVSHDIEARDGTRLRVWECGPKDAEEAVLFFHGAITSSRGMFAPPTDDGAYSWLQYAAERGQRVFALDIRGYGRSDPIPEYDDQPSANAPAVRAPQAARDGADALSFVADRAETLHLCTLSWGTIYTMLLLSGDLPDVGADIAQQVSSLVAGAPVYEPTWDFESMADSMGVPTDLGGYFVLEETDSGEDTPGPERLSEDISAIRTDSVQGIDETSYRVPAGPQADTRDCTNGDPPYDPGAVDIPTLLIRGENDILSERLDTLALYDDLGTDGLTEYIEVSDSSHYFSYEPYREVFFEAAYGFQQRVRGLES